jgi:uncharacterized repeat protein (TIGR01451 family)
LGLSLAGTLPAQVITDFNPKYGSAGDTITIDGSGFASNTITVRFWNGVVAAGRYINSDSKITVTNVPAGISTGPLSVQRDAGVINYSADIFAVINPWAFIERIDPDYGAVGDGVDIYGAHFGTAPVVKFGGVTAVAIADGNGTHITTYVPSGAPSNSTLTVTALGGTATNPGPFTVVGAGPYIDSFSPEAGSDTQPVTLTGLHFTGTTSVKFNGVSAAFDPVVNDKKIDTYAPSGVTTGPLSVTTTQGTHTTSTFFYGPIRLKGFNPSSGPVGTQVLISGTNFTGATSVRFGGFTGVAASFVVSNNTQIMATVPTNAPTGLLVIATPAGSLPTSSNFVVTPSLLGFTPAAGPAGTPVQITGSRLVDNGGGAPVVKFDGVNATVSSWSAQQVVAVAPASSSGFITLTTADGSSTSATIFYYPPQITGFTPNADPPGSTVTITGQSLTNASGVLFNGVPSTNLTVLSNTSIQAVVPPGLTTGPITVTTPGGTTNSAALYYAAPAISAFAPNAGGPGTSVTVFGSSFQGTTAVKFNGTDASFSSVTPSQLTAVVPAGASTGPISVTAPAGTATSAEAFVVPQVSDLRVNTFLHAPNPVTVGEDLTLTIVPSNDGPNTASNVTASVTVAPGMVVKSAGSTTPGVTVNTNGNPVVFNLGRMTVFSNPTLVLVLVPQANGLATNTVVFTSTMFDPNPANNTDSRVTTVLPAPELSIGTLESNQVRVAWPVELTNWTLQSTTLLTNSAAWSAVPTPPVIEGNERVMTEPRTGATKFYRLQK